MWSKASLASRPNFFGGGELEGNRAGSALIKPMANSTETEIKVHSKFIHSAFTTVNLAGLHACMRTPNDPKS